MLRIHIKGQEHYDEDKNEFVEVDGFDLELEHSLASLSKWESVYEKPFLASDEKTNEEVVAYVDFMRLTPNPPEDYLQRISKEDYDRISEYIHSKQSATTFMDSKAPASKQIMTSEMIYYQMTLAGIPFECQYWHLNRLITLIRIHSVKNTKPKKMSRSEVAARNRELNAQRRAKYGTSG